MLIIQKSGDGNRFWNTMIRRFQIFKTKANTFTNLQWSITKTASRPPYIIMCALSMFKFVRFISLNWHLKNEL